MVCRTVVEHEIRSSKRFPSRPAVDLEVYLSIVRVSIGAAFPKWVIRGSRQRRHDCRLVGCGAAATRQKADIVSNRQESLIVLHLAQVGRLTGGDRCLN